MSLRSSWIVVAAVCAALAGVWTARETLPMRPHLLSGTWLTAPRPVGPFTLVDQHGAPFTAAQLRGAPALLYFGYTHSTEVCPAVLEMLTRISRSGVVPGLRVIFVTLDPKHDGPQELARYVSAFDSKIIALTGSVRAIDTLAARLGLGFKKIELPGGDYTIDHTTVLYLLNAAGRTVAIFTGPFASRRLERDLRRAAPWLRAARVRS